MSHIEGKDKILRVAEELIIKKGYNAISAREIARKAKMSAGTLYHHFPNGKLSILYEIILSYGNKFLETFDISKIGDLSEPEILSEYLLKVIEKHRQFAPLIKGFEIELFNNKKVISDLEVLMESRKPRFKELFTDMFLKFYPNIKEPEKTFSIAGRIVNSLIHTHVIFENFYGTDKELVQILSKMVKGLLTSD